MAWEARRAKLHHPKAGSGESMEGAWSWSPAWPGLACTQAWDLTTEPPVATLGGTGSTNQEGPTAPCPPPAGGESTTGKAARKCDS